LVEPTSTHVGQITSKEGGHNVHCVDNVSGHNGGSLTFPKLHLWV